MVNGMLKYLTDQKVLPLVKRIWLDIERDINGAYMWSRTNFAANLNKVKAAINACKKWGKLPGIYAPGAGGWSEMMGSTNAKIDDTVPMWYVSRKGYNNDASDNDWVPFANWQTPGAHQFYSGDTSNAKVCGVAGVDWTWRSQTITLPYNWDTVNNRPM